MARKLFYKISSNPDVLYETKELAFDAAANACCQCGEPQVLMTVGTSGEIGAWEVVATEKLFDRFNQRRSALVTVIQVACS